MANGVSAHALDYDDHGHASTHCLPAALALGEQQDASGRELLLAYIVGREVCLHLSEAFDRGGWEGSGPKGRGWHSVGILGSIGAAAAAAKVLRLDPQAICVAFGIASSLGGGLFANRGTMTKPLHAGNAARNGVLASLLTAKGFTAEPEIFTSPGGFVDVYQHRGEFNIEEVAKNLRRRFLIAEQGIRIKAYPYCSPAHRYIEAMRHLRSRYSVTPEAVETIACTPSKSLRCLYPKTDLECKFSAAFSLVATLVDGEVNLRNCTEAFLKRRDVQSLLAKTVYVNGPSGSGGFVRVKTTAGDVYEEPLSPPRELTTYEEMRAKFYACARTAIPEPHAQRIESLVRKLEELPSVHEVCQLLQP